MQQTKQKLQVVKVDYLLCDGNVVNCEKLLSLSTKGLKVAQNVVAMLGENLLE
jgi:hypothetical protein